MNAKPRLGDWVTKEIQTDFGIIRYTHHYKKVKNMNLRVKPDGEVSLSTDPKVKQEAVDRFIASKAEFIQKALQRFDEKRDSRQQFAPTEGFYLLGNPVRLRFYQGKERAFLRPKEQELWLYIKDPSSEEEKSANIEKWRRVAGYQVFSEVMEKWMPLVEPLGIDKPQLKIRKMKSRWGSCNYYTKTITLSLHLLEAPMEAVEYVILHELCHLREPNHSKAFHQLVASVMPDWKERKKLLYAMGIRE